MSRPTALVLAASGTNRDRDVAFALDRAGAHPQIVLLAELAANPTLLGNAQMLVIAGGFSFASEVKSLFDALRIPSSTTVHSSEGTHVRRRNTEKARMRSGEKL